MKKEMKKFTISEFDKEVRSLINDTSDSQMHTYALERHSIGRNGYMIVGSREEFTNFEALMNGLHNYDMLYHIAQADEIVGYIPDRLIRGYIKLNKSGRDDDGPLIDLASYMICDMLRNGIEYISSYNTSFVVRRVSESQSADTTSDFLLKYIKFQLTHFCQQDTQNYGKNGYTPFLFEDVGSNGRGPAVWHTLDLLTQHDKENLLEYFKEEIDYRFIHAYKDFISGLDEYKDWVLEFCVENGVQNRNELDFSQEEILFDSENDVWFDNYNFEYYVVDEIIRKLIGQEIWEDCEAIEVLRNKSRDIYFDIREIEYLITDVHRSVSNTINTEEIQKIINSGSGD